METVARKQISQFVEEVQLVQVRATKPIALCDATMREPTVISKGELFWVNIIPMPGFKTLGAHYKGENFFVKKHEFELVAN